MARSLSNQSSVASPLLRWAGSKRKVLPHLLPFWKHSTATRYIEPFVGSAALFFAATPANAVLSDSNSELIETYRAVKAFPNDVADELERLPRDKDTYLALRRQLPQRLLPSQHAARFLYLNRNCFNGLYRTNQKGEFNVPYAPSKTGQMPDRSRIRAVASSLARTQLYCGDFEQVVRRVVRADDFVYLDPPYAVANRRIFKQYNATTFGFEDLHRLSALLYAIDAIGAHFLLSYAVCSEALAAFRSWPQMRVTTHRNIAGFAAHRRTSMELVVSNVLVR
jgi:DNA adenine methylase